MAVTVSVEGTPQELIDFLAEHAENRRYRLTDIFTSPRSVTPEEIAAANARLLSHRLDVFDSAHLENDAIDADLAREYGGATSSTLIRSVG